MKTTLVISLFLLLSPNSNAQATTEMDKKFNWAINVLDNWLIEHKPVCDICLTPEKLEELNLQLDSISFSYLAPETFVSMYDIFDAFTILETITGLKTTVQYNLGTLGISCIDCSAYESDKQNWISWYAINKAILDPTMEESLKNVPRKS